MTASRVAPDDAFPHTAGGAEVVPAVSEIHGERRVDDYLWLREKEDPEVRAYLEAENAYTDAVMRPTEAFQAALYDEMLGRIQETDQNVPYRQGGFFYYSRTEQGKQYPIHCRRKGSLEAPEEVTLDLNRLAEGEAVHVPGAYAGERRRERSSPTRPTTPASASTRSSSRTSRPGELVEKVAEKVGSVAWAADDRTLFYTVEEESTKRQYRLYRHRVGTDGPRPRLRGGGRGLQRGRRPHAEPALTSSSARGSLTTARGALPRAADPPRASGGWSPRGSPSRSTTSTTTATSSTSG